MGKSVNYMDPRGRKPVPAGAERGVPATQIKQVSPKGIVKPPAPKFGMQKGSAAPGVRRGK
jgi:hypothetical protein